MLLYLDGYYTYGSTYPPRALTSSVPTSMPGSNMILTVFNTDKNSYKPAINWWLACLRET